MVKIVNKIRIIRGWIVSISSSTSIDKLNIHFFKSKLKIKTFKITVF